VRHQRDPAAPWRDAMRPYGGWVLGFANEILVILAALKVPRRFPLICWVWSMYQCLWF
jgi:hypothetical protein